MILFHTDGEISLNLKNKRILKNWIKQTFINEGKKVKDLNIILCDDEYLLAINKEYLNHDYYTDIITFPIIEDGDICGDLYISYDRVVDNAKSFKTSINKELYRIIIHGVLHLIGYDDHTKEERAFMSKKEDEYLNRLELITAF